MVPTQGIPASDSNVLLVDGVVCHAVDGDTHASTPSRLCSLVNCRSMQPARQSRQHGVMAYATGQVSDPASSRCFLQVYLVSRAEATDCHLSSNGFVLSLCWSGSLDNLHSTASKPAVVKVCL